MPLIDLITNWMNRNNAILRIDQIENNTWRRFVVDVDAYNDSVPYKIFGHDQQYQQLDSWGGFASAYELRVENRHERSHVRVCWRVASGYVNNNFPPADHPRDGQGSWQDRINLVQDCARASGLGVGRNTGDIIITPENPEQTRAVAIFNDCFFEQLQQQVVDAYMNRVLTQIRGFEQFLNGLQQPDHRVLFGN